MTKAPPSHPWRDKRSVKRKCKACYRVFEIERSHPNHVCSMACQKALNHLERKNP
jgi:rRNA maturation endonuclease Nob1